MTTPSRLCLLLHPDDDVLVALADLAQGTRLAEQDLTCAEDIPAGHKVARRDLAPGQPVRKYGQMIGTVLKAVPAGSHLHSHNLGFQRPRHQAEAGADARATELLPEPERAAFMGYAREDGRAGTRNYLGVLATVGCSASVCQFITQAAAQELQPGRHGVDGIIALTHDTGCGQSADSDGFRNLQRVLAGHARHPNFAGVLLVGLGCEVNQACGILRNAGMAQGPGLRVLDIQQAGGTEETVRQGVAALAEMLPHAAQAQREALPLSRLVVGLECGGSDAYSGLTANPALGAAVDRLVRHGGTAILSETPEIYGAEHLLIRRAASPQVGDALAGRIEWWEEYTQRHGASLDNNPTPGNKAGGLTTILEKSLGAVAKGGSTNLEAVYEYAQPVSARGLVFMDTPGQDLVSITGMAAGGANLVCFTTGRGSVCGTRPAPVIKLATNSPLYERMSGDMDLNCGGIVRGETTVDEMGRAIFQAMLDTASGRLTKSEAQGFGGQEFAPWQIGAVL